MPRGNPRPLKERFFESLPVDRDPSKCWQWQAGLFSTGYGQIWSGGSIGTNLGAHRVAWEFANDRKVPEGMCVLHSCDNRSCCNPSHLRLGTKLDNYVDSVERDRNSKGEAHGNSKVPDWIIKEALKFLKTGVSQVKVAKMLTNKGWPCDPKTVSNWATGKTRGIKS